MLLHNSSSTTGRMRITLSSCQLFTTKSFTSFQLQKHLHSKNFVAAKLTNRHAVKTGQRAWTYGAELPLREPPFLLIRSFFLHIIPADGRNTPVLQRAVSGESGTGREGRGGMGGGRRVKNETCLSGPFTRSLTTHQLCRDDTHTHRHTQCVYV